MNVVVETPAGSRNKYRYDEAAGSFVLHKMLPIGMAFPFDFGFLPGTKADDGDPLDVVLLGGEPTFAGCIVPARILGVIEAEQQEKDGKVIRNDRLIATAETAKIRPLWEDLEKVPKEILDAIETFFVSYNRAEGRVFRPIARRGAAAALKAIESAGSGTSHGRTSSDPS